MSIEQLSRREFVELLGRGAAGAACGGLMAGCATGGRSAPDECSFPCFAVAGTPREIGRGAGRRFGGAIRTGLERRSDWFAELKAFARGDEGRPALAAFRAAAEQQAPRALAELRGWAEGAEVPFEDLLVLNLKAELRALIDRRAEDVPGCSTVVLAVPGESVIHLHNEDGHEAYTDLMFLLRVAPADGPSFQALTYPGILPGNGPAVNECGIAQTTNFIATRDVRPGVGRYFLSRMVCEARTVAEAVRWATHAERAFGFHHVLTSSVERRSFSVSVAPARGRVDEIDGLFFHTNHFVAEGMTGEAQDQAYLSTSSLSRFEVIERWAAGVTDPRLLDRDDLLVPLKSHAGRPTSPCRHPRAGVTGCTLATAVIEAPGEEFRLSRGQPCLERWRAYPLFPSGVR